MLVQFCFHLCIINLNMMNYFKIKYSVIVELTGGLGNQMFQYAAGLALAKFKGKSLIIDYSRLEKSVFGCQLKALNVNENLLYFDKKNFLHENFINKFNKKLGLVFNQNLKIYREKNYNYEPLFFEQGAQSIILSGYFQSYLYFSKVEDLIREHFIPKNDNSKEYIYWSEKIENSKNSISLHVRRGDYLNKKTSDFHGVLGINYYKRAIELMAKIVGGGYEIFVFSDDHDYVDNTFLNVPFVNIVKTNSNAPWEDMFLMSKCQHNIIANSSYSWWGAWLNVNKERQVIAPAKWFSNSALSSVNVLDLFPDDWILLK